MLFKQGKTILFVCCVNRDRSVIAEKRLNQQINGEFPALQGKVTVTSAGIVPSAYIDHAQRNGIPFLPPYFGKNPNPSTVAYLAGKGIDVASYVSREISKDLATRTDLVLTMDSLLRDAVIHRYPQAREKVFTFKQYVFEDETYGLDIGDPWALPVINAHTGSWQWPEGYIETYTTDIELCLFSGLDKLIQFIEV